MAFIVGALAGAGGMYWYLPDGPKRASASASSDRRASEGKASDFSFYGALERKAVSHPPLEEAPPTVPTLLARPPAPPSDAPAAVAPAAPVVEQPWFLQLAALTSQADAESLKASVILAGEPVQISTVETVTQGSRYRVRVGPFADKASLEEARARLAQAGIAVDGAFAAR